jgi:hypothetical protein
MMTSEATRAKELAGLWAEHDNFAAKAANETNSRLRERWSGIAVGMFTVLNRIAPRALSQEPQDAE